MESESIRPLAQQEFEQIRQLAYRSFGLDLKSGKEELVSARLGKLVRNGGFRSFHEYYLHILEDRTGRALVGMIDALATNHTSFLREPDHFEFLRTQVIPRLAGRESLEIWCAACSTGEEVWTLACLLNEALPQRKIHIVASDISIKALAIAKRASYPIDRCRTLPVPWLSRYFVPQGHPPEAYGILPALRTQVSFRRINLVEPLVRTRQFPVVFCRNVMIYFDRHTQATVVRHLSDCLEPGGYLFIGHAESLTSISHSLEYIRPAVYRKPEKREGRWTRS